MLIQALKLYIRSRSAVLSERSAVILHLEELVENKVTITDLEAIDLYDEAFREVLLEKEKSWGKIIGALRWQHVKSSPKDEQNILKCFQECLTNGDLDHARQVSRKFLEYRCSL